MLPSQPILIPADDSPFSSVSSLSLSNTPPSPAPSELSLAPSHDSDDDDDALSVADTADSCCALCCPHSEDPQTPKVGFDTASSAFFDPPTAVDEAPLPPLVVDEAAFTPLIIIGAGPHALALAARLSEPRPAALYTDLEHARLSWLQREQAASEADGRARKERRKTVKGHWAARKLVQPESATLAPPTPEGAKKPFAVLDSSSDRWMARWNGFFEGLKIRHLRSPMLFHPSPADVDALVAYTRRMGKGHELEPVKNVVGKEFSKYQRKKHPGRVGRAVTVNERDRQDYFRPKTTLFRSFIASDLINRYSLSSAVTHTFVTSLSYRDVHVRGRGVGVEKAFVVESVKPDGTKEVRVAKAAVMAIGPSSRPNIPKVLKEALRPMQPAVEGAKGENEQRRPWDKSEVCGEAWCHSSAFGMEGCRPMDGPLGDKVRQGEPTRVVVVGGGLTSAQIVDSLLESGVSHVTLVARSHIKTKHFDFDLEWVSKYNNLTKMQFWQEDDRQARWDMIHAARNSGSVNPHFLRVLQKHAKSGRLTLLTLTSVESASFDPSSSKWRFEVVTQPDAKTVARADPALGSAQPIRSTIEGADYLVSSTGSMINLEGVPFVRPVVKSHPVEVVNGLPVLTADLQWRKDLPLFVMGAYSMLELGPDALNLSGTRAGAERIAHRLGELGIFDDVEGGGVTPVDTARSGRKKVSARMREKESRSGGMDNFFAGLGEVEA
ncbi:hypothetical protein JCM8097_008480 [Rhodosporidiobolus ruineniae]